MTVEVKSLWSEVIAACLELQMNKGEEEGEGEEKEEGEEKRKNRGSEVERKRREWEKEWKGRVLEHTKLDQ